ncbi:MAG TPA: IPT/TIG domain-containing protein [Candidatus Kapabacteria bacterium]|nr:IPT/TIG domain-containing protein [Candidatus Kapabacteria bacterium]
MAIALSVVFFFCNKNQSPVISTPPPVKILSFSPTTARIGNQIVITGENFSSDKTTDSVFFAHRKLALIDSVTDSVTLSKLYVRVPQGTVTGTIAVRIGSATDTSKQIFTLDTIPLPTIINLQPGTGPLGTLITITGTNFDTAQGHTIVTMGGVREKIISISSTKIVVELVGGTSGAITITMNSDTLMTPTNFIVTKRNATITAFTPARGKVGTQVTIFGTNFNPDTTGLVVTFGTVPAQVVSVTSTQIVTAVPPGAVSAPINVSFFGEQVTSATAFQVERKYQFDSVYVEVGNIPALILNDIISDGDHYDTTRQNLSFPTCSSICSYSSILSHGDTSVFLYSNNYIIALGSGTCIDTVKVIYDTTKQIIESLLTDEYNNWDWMSDANSYTYASNFLSVQFVNIPFSQDSVLVKGNNAQSCFINGNSFARTTYPRGNGGETHQSFQFLPFTDSTYIKIVLK